MKVFFRYFFIILSIAIVLVLLFTSIYRLMILYSVGQNPELFFKDSIDYHFRDHLLLGYIHIIPGILFLILGGHQLIPYFRKSNYGRHRLIGKIFLLLSAVIFGSAIILGARFPYGDWMESTVTVIFGSFLLYCTYKAYRTARNKEFIAHRNWVTRIYFIAIAVSTIRGIIALFMITGDTSMQEVFGLAFFIAFVIHLVLVETWIRFLAR
jgi:predicted membrane protein DUF2306